MKPVGTSRFGNFLKRIFHFGQSETKVASTSDKEIGVSDQSPLEIKVESNHDSEIPRSENLKVDDSEQDTSIQTTKTQYLLTQLIVMTILIIGLILFISIYPNLRQSFRNIRQVNVPTARLSQTPSITPTITPPFTPTNTLRYSLTPTISLTPTTTSSPTITPTPAGPPTLTPARPVANNDVYKLQNWTAEKAELLIQMMEDYPNTLTRSARREDNSGYWAAYKFAISALRESLLRFPDDPKSESWRWKLAYNLVRTGDIEVVNNYAEIITNALNQGDVTLGNLRTWFNAKEPRLDLYLVEMEPPVGYYSSYLVQIEGPGSAFIWLLETSSGYEAYPLQVTYDLVNPIPSHALLADLNNDNLDEVIIYSENSEGISELVAPEVYDLSKVPPTQLSYQAGDENYFVGLDFENRWIISPKESGENKLVFEGKLFPACPTTIRFEYHWNGKELKKETESFEVKPSSDLLSFCKVILDHSSEYWGPQAFIDIADDLFPNWPPINGEDGSLIKPDEAADLLDEIRFRLGLSHAMLGNFEEANRYMSMVGQPPSTTSGSWYSIVKLFQSDYITPTDIYQSCLDVESCNASEALNYLVNQLPEEAEGDPVAYLSKFGVFPIASGYFDLDGDGSKDRWISLRHRPLEGIELWGFLNTPAGPKGIRIGTINSNRPDLEYINDQVIPPVIQLDKEKQFRISLQSETYSPVIEWISEQNYKQNRFDTTVNEAELDLLAGRDPTKVQTALKYLETDPGLLCKATWSCDKYYYLLGLSSELAGDKRSAIHAYLQLWRDYIRSPYTIFARMKLEGIALAIGTPITATPSLTVTLLPTLTPGTPYPEYPYPYPTEVYPYP